MPAVRAAFFVLKEQIFSYPVKPVDNMRRYVIIGTGAAGIAAAESIRCVDEGGEIILINEEPQGYYSRPGLAYYLTGELSEEMLFPFSNQDFQRLKARRVKAQVTHIDPDGRRVQLNTGATVSYDRLLISVGAAAAASRFPGSDLQGVVKMDNMDDVRGILKMVRKARAAVVVGGGITALELVEGFVARRVKTHYLLRGERYWKNVLDPTESHIIQERLTEEGVQIHYHTEIEEILGKRGKVVGVRTKDGRQIPCNIVAVAIGVRPRLELAKSLSLEIDRGILVDEFLQTGRDNIYAAGDVAQVFDPLTGKHAIDSLWGPAREQGRAAGANMAGVPTPYRKAVPFNVTRLANLTTTIIGTVGRGGDDDLLMTIARGDSETWRELPDAIAAQSDFNVNRLRLMVAERHIIGAIVMGDQTLSQPLHHIISQQVDITPIREALIQPDAPLADIIAEFWTKYRTNYAAKKQY